MTLKTWQRLAVLSMAGGGLFQLGGCVDSLAPTVLAIGEQVLFSALFSGGLPIF